MKILRDIYIPKATIAIIIFNIICFIYEISPCKVFRHISVDHINSNMTYLLLFGSYVESKVGWKRFAVCYLLSGLGGHILWNIMDGRPSAGSSSAVWGIIGMYLYLYRYPDVSITIAEDIVLYIAEFIIALSGAGGKWIMASAFLYDLYRAIYHTDNAAACWSHVGGFLTGAIFGSFINSKIGAGAVTNMKLRMGTLADNKMTLPLFAKEGDNVRL
ncbi:MAG: rhomboid family intramembrane serine protease [Deltaproteobacteria bacterium]|nr:rhomboid family intramembrane serine protease [Deltaproteobacteria bacterium]